MSARTLSPDSGRIVYHLRRIVVVAEPYDAQEHHAGRGVHVHPFSGETGRYPCACTPRPLPFSHGIGHFINVLRSGAGQ